MKLNRTIEIQSIKETRQGLVLLKMLYKKFLRKDPLFHYFFEPEIIIRLSEPKIIRGTRTYLDKKGIKYVEYPYPFGPNKSLYGASPKDKPIYDELMALYHSHAVASLTFTKKDMQWYTNRTIHCLFNMRGLEYHEEVIEATAYAYNYALVDKKYDHDKRQDN